MSAGWIAAGVRGRGLVRRRIGDDGARRVAASASLEGGIAELAGTSYGRDLRPGLDLAAAQHAVSAAVLWHLRVLAGWVPPLGSGPLRILAAGFEIANVSGHLAELSGQPATAPYELGTMGTAWRAVSAARTPGEVRASLRASAWGDPGREDLASVRLALALAWARLVLDGVPGAGAWAVGGAALVLARVVAAGAGSELAPTVRRDAARLVGPDWERARSVDELAGHLPVRAARALRDVTDARDLWVADARWWSNLEAEADTLAGRSPPDASAGIGAMALLAADARRVRAALAVAARGGQVVGSLDAVA